MYLYFATLKTLNPLFRSRVCTAIVVQVPEKRSGSKWLKSQKVSNNLLSEKTSIFYSAKIRNITILNILINNFYCLWKM